MHLGWESFMRVLTELDLISMANMNNEHELNPAAPCLNSLIRQLLTSYCKYFY